MEHLSNELHLGWVVGVVVRELQGGLVETLLEGSALGAFEAETPAEHITVNETNRDIEVGLFLDFWVRSKVL